MAADDSSDDELFASLAKAGGEQVKPGFADASPPSLWSSSDDDDDDGLDAETGGSRKSRPKTVGSFIIGDKLGEGAYAVVREAINRETLRMVAAKVVDLRRLRKVRGGLENIRREILVQKSLKRHTNLVELVHAEEDLVKQKAYLFMEICNGCTLQQLIESSPSRRLPESQVSHLLFGALSGLLYMHRRGIVHRDIKPGNMLITAEGELKIADFGVAEFLDAYTIEDNVSRTSGSPAFQAPEIANGEKEYSGMKVDVWAVGVTAYNMLSGDVPFTASNLLELFRLISVGEYKRLDFVSESAQDAVNHMLDMDWHSRWSVEEMLRHPWIAGSERAPSREQREADGWVAVPRKKFSILDHVQRLVDDGQMDMVFSGSSRLAASSSSRTGKDLAHSSNAFRDMFAPPSDSSSRVDGRHRKIPGSEVQSNIPAYEPARDATLRDTDAGSQSPYDVVLDPVMSSYSEEVQVLEKNDTPTSLTALAPRADSTETRPLGSVALPSGSDDICEMKDSAMRPSSSHDSHAAGLTRSVTGDRSEQLASPDGAPPFSTCKNASEEISGPGLFSERGNACLPSDNDNSPTPVLSAALTRDVTAGAPSAHTTNSQPRCARASDLSGFESSPDTEQPDMLSSSIRSVGPASDAACETDETSETDNLNLHSLGKLSSGSIQQIEPTEVRKFMSRERCGESRAIVAQESERASRRTVPTEESVSGRSLLVGTRSNALEDSSVSRPLSRLSGDGGGYSTISDRLRSCTII